MNRMTSAALAAAMTAAAAGSAAAQQDFHWSGRLAAGQTIEIRNIKGEIRAEPAGGDEVTVTARRTGGRADRVRVEMVRRANGVVVCAIYPPRDDDDDDGGRGGWRHRDGGDDEPRDACNSGRGMNVRDGDADVDFVVRVPAGVKFAAKSVSGDVEVNALRGPVDAASVSGDVHVSSTAEVRANSVSGNVFAALGRIPSNGLSFHSVSGDVTLELPSGTDADFSARTISGEIDSDFPLTIEGRGRRGDDDDDDRGWPRVRVHVGHDMHARLGRGGPGLNVTTVSGDINLRRAR
ncbi:MAG TPA: hypothetical protein VFJ82_18350 [Longimicrobium sp.]|nr:hypothetical protein [Longimicrobium sp.]